MRRSRSEVLALALLCVASGGIACGRSDLAASPASAADAPAAPGADRRLSLDPAALRRAGVETAPVAAGSSDGGSPVFGRVLDPLPLVEAVAARETARAVVSAAASDLRRVRALHRADDSASQRELEAAETTFRRAQLELATARARLLAGWGAALAENPSLERESAAFASGRAALARLELPVGDADLGPPGSLQLASAIRPDHPLDAELIGPAPTTDPLTQGRAFLARLGGEPPPPGTALAGRLVFPRAARAGLRIPAAAVVREAGRTLVYRAREDGRFERVFVSLLAPLGADWLAEAPLSPGARIVTAGAQELLSAEVLARQPVD